MNKISLMQIFKKRNNLKEGMRDLGYELVEELRTIELVKLFPPALIYAQNDEFFYVDFDESKDIDQGEIKFAFKKEMVIVNTRFCVIFKKDNHAKVELFYKGALKRIEDVALFQKMQKHVLQKSNYYLGYERRYQKVYENGVGTWESTSANQSLMAVYKQFNHYFNGKKVIDLGCGEGRDSIYLKTLGIDVVGVDISCSALIKARELAKLQNLDIDFIESNVLFLNAFENESFDTAINMGCLHMIVEDRERKEHIKNVHRILKEDGIFIVDHCQRDWGKNFFSLPPELYDKEKMVIGNEIKRRVRTEYGTKLMNLEVIPYMEKEERVLTKEITSLGFKKLYSSNNTSEAFGNSALIIFKRQTI